MKVARVTHRCRAIGVLKGDVPSWFDHRSTCPLMALPANSMNVRLGHELTSTPHGSFVRSKPASRRVHRLGSKVGLAAVGPGVGRLRSKRNSPFGSTPEQIHP